MMPTPAPVPVHLQPAAQSNTLDIPDQVTGAGVPVSNTNPEQIMLIGPSVTATPYTYQPPVVTRQPGGDLLVAPHITVTPEPTSGVPQTQIINGGALIENAAAPDTSPEGTGNGYNRDFSVKLVEVVEDFRAESGYRVIDYFPDYQLQPGEQILVEWNVVGVSKLKIDNLAADALNSKGAEYANPERFPDSVRTIVCDTFDHCFEEIDDELDEDSFLIIVTRGHRGDLQVLRQALRKPHKYLGMIGSRHKNSILFEQLLKEGFTQEELDAVYTPIGLEIKSETPEEIGVSIAAEMILVRATD